MQVYKLAVLGLSLTQDGPRHISVQNSDMQITSYLLRYLLRPGTLVQQAIKRSRAQQREELFFVSQRVSHPHSEITLNKWQQKGAEL